MADSTILPGARAQLVVGQGIPSPEFYRFFQAVANAAGLTGNLQTQVTEITQVIDGMQGNQGRLMAGEGIEVQGTLAAGIAIVSLEMLDDEGGGALVKISRDAYGRVSGTSAAKTDDLPEGITNLYFTAARVNSALAAGDGISLTYSAGVTTITLVGLPIYLVDEAGNQLTDEVGNPLVDSVTTGLPVPFSVITDTPTTRDGYGIADVPLKTDPAYFPPFTSAGAPSAASSQYKAITVTDLAEGARPCWSDGTNWRRFSDNSIAV